MPVMSDAGMMVPACTTYGDAGAATRSALVVRRSTEALTKASLRSWPFCANPSSETGVAGWEDWPGVVGVALTAVGCTDAAGSSRILVEANNLLKRAASIS